MKLYNEKKGSLLNTINFSHQRRISSDTFASCKHLRSSTWPKNPPPPGQQVGPGKLCKS